MKKVMIDSCVFFGMIEYNDVYSKYGEKGLDRLLAHRKNSVNNLETDIRKAIGEEFFNEKKISNLSFDDQINQYKEFANNKIASLEKRIESKKRVVTGEADPYKKITEEAKNKAREVIILLEQEKAKITPYRDVEEMLNLYRLQKNSYNSGLIYKGSMNDNFKLYLNAYSYDEILNHTIQKDNPQWLCFTREQVDSLSKHFTKVYTTSSNVIDVIDKLSSEYRTQNNLPNDTPMGNDINSVNEYGDSKIAAFSNLVGINLVTHNAKDFIFDNSYGKLNYFIRNHLKNVNASHKLTTDAGVYTTTELLSGKVPEPKIEPKIKISSKSQSDFSEELDMGL